jgi:ribulose kinase
MKLREQKLAIEAEQRREAMRQAWHEAEAQKNRERQQAVETERAAWLRKAKADCSPEEWAHIASLSSEELDAWRRECPFKD